MMAYRWPGNSYYATSIETSSDGFPYTAVLDPTWEYAVLGNHIRFRRQSRRSTTRGNRPWQREQRLRWRRIAKKLAFALTAGFAVVIASILQPGLGVGGVVDWLHDQSRMVASARDLMLLSSAMNAGQVLRPPVPGSLAFQLCAGRSRQDCVVDGDTIWHSGVKIRLADIDTPEVFSPQCESEAALGRQATERLLELMNAGQFEVVQSGRDMDRFGRQLRILERGGRSLGDILVAEGLARPWDGARRSWCG
jgi:endonuclease YncB( thermonuclease family)